MRELPTPLVETISAHLGGRACRGEPLARHTSFRIGGPAEFLVVPETVEELAFVVRAAAECAARVTLLGGGSNVLVGDRGLRGVVVKLGRGFARVEWDKTEVRAGAAANLGRLARAAAGRGLAGLEHAEGIPGTVGGALFMNAGAYGGDVAGAAIAVEGLDAGGEPVVLPRAALGFRYRGAALPPRFVVTAVRFALRQEAAASVRRRMEEVRRHRVASQPHGRANAGSIFKNPFGDHAGRLIDVAGLKGARIGRARISERHANFIVNEGGSSAGAVKGLLDLVQRVECERSEVWVEPEVRFVGSW